MFMHEIKIERKSDQIFISQPSPYEDDVCVVISVYQARSVADAIIQMLDNPPMGKAE